MWRVLAIALTLTGCARLFDLEPPVHEDGPGQDGSVGRDAANDGHPGGDGGADGSLNALCPMSYMTVLGTSPSRYRVVTNQAIPWANAQTACLADQVANSARYTHLVVGASDAELSALDSAVSIEIWVGLSDRAIEDSYQWVTQENNNYPPASGDPWGSGEPMASDADDCVAMNTTGDLQVIACGNGRGFVCECDAFMNDPTRY